MEASLLCNHIVSACDQSDCLYSLILCDMKLHCRLKVRVEKCSRGRSAHSFTCVELQYNSESISTASNEFSQNQFSV
jgi:hypothetical protein